MAHFTHWSSHMRYTSWTFIHFTSTPCFSCVRGNCVHFIHKGYAMHNMTSIFVINTYLTTAQADTRDAPRESEIKELSHFSSLWPSIDYQLTITCSAFCFQNACSITTLVWFPDPSANIHTCAGGGVGARRVWGITIPSHGSWNLIIKATPYLEWR